MSKSFELAKEFLGREVDVTVDRPLGSKHPKHGFIYRTNYGYIDGVKAPDGENLDAYYLGVNRPVRKGRGIVTAIVHGLNDDDDKLVVEPPGAQLTDKEIESLINFQEQWFRHQIIRDKERITVI